MWAEGALRLCSKPEFGGGTIILRFFAGFLSRTLSYLWYFRICQLCRIVPETRYKTCIIKVVQGFILNFSLLAFSRWQSWLLILSPLFFLFYTLCFSKCIFSSSFGVHLTKSCWNKTCLEVKP